MKLNYRFFWLVSLLFSQIVNGSNIDSFAFENRVLHQFNLGISEDTSSVKIEIGKDINDDNLYLIVQKPNIDFLEIKNLTSGEVLISGQSVSHSSKSVDPYSFCKISAGDLLIVRVYSNEQIVLPISLETEVEINNLVFIRNIFSGVFMGLLGGLILYNLILFFFLRDRTYFYYVFYLLFISIAQLDIIGFNFYLFRDYPVVYNNIMHFSSGVSGVFAMLFLQRFMHTKEEIPWGHKLLGIIAILYSMVIGLILMGFDLYSYRLIQLGALSLPVAMIIAYKLALKGNRPALYVAISWTVLTVGIMLYTFKDFGFIPFNSFTNYTLAFGVALEAILLSLALANKITLLNSEKDEANTRALSETKKNEELVRNQNTTLEHKVVERTSELQNALDHLKETQSQLVQSEKMASLGTLTAGIAHEINNPINFVSANVLPLRDNINDITNLIKEYKAIDFRNLKSELVRIAKLEKDLELDYMLNETKELVDGIEEGAQRTHTIVEGLTTFSRGDSGTKAKANINKGIKSTLSVLKSRINDVNLTLDLDKELPMVVCEIGKINQVVLNLMNNALDALEDKFGANSPNSKISIKSWEEKSRVMIQVQDNADGMDKETREKVLEPFYTTKPVGKGTGLGLSISYSIIEDHKGDIELISAVGEGTTFIISLPIDPPVG